VLKLPINLLESAAGAYEARFGRWF
jgi:hypothetical protein